MFINIEKPAEQLEFSEAVLQGTGSSGGLLMPDSLQPLTGLDAILGRPDRISRATALLKALIGDDPLAEKLPDILEQTAAIPLPLVRLDERISVLELFHGPSQSFKDFGVGFLIACLGQLPARRRRVILTATSGDTGGAVAQAAAGRDGIEALILYPQAGVSAEQARFFCIPEPNITSIAVDGSFDDCQRLVKQAFADPELDMLELVSANSINIARLLAQLLYYFELAVQHEYPRRLLLAIPSGNFGNATAALMSCALGLPFAGVLAVTNENDTVPRFLSQGRWEPAAVRPTISNAMDIADPNNFSRIRWLLGQQPQLRARFRAVAIDEQRCRAAIRALVSRGYPAEPHTALAWQAVSSRAPAEWFAGAAEAAVLATASTAKFAARVAEITGAGKTTAIPPDPRPDLTMAADYKTLRRILTQVCIIR